MRPLIDSGNSRDLLLMISDLPGDLKYTQEHGWLREEEVGTVTIGITDYSQGTLGDLVCVELPEVGQELETGGELAVIESVKSAADICGPVAGEVVQVNEDLFQNADIVNSDPYGEGWIARVQPFEDLSKTMTPDQYQSMLDEISD